MEHPQLLPMIRSQVRERLNSYMAVPQITTNINQYVVSPQLGNKAGIMGAFVLAQQAADLNFTSL